MLTSCVDQHGSRTAPTHPLRFRLAIGSYVEQYSNSVQIVKKNPASAGDLNSQLYQVCEFDHPYPCTKILWSPDARSQGGKDLLATTGDYLRVWNVTDDQSGRGTLIPKKEALLNNVSLIIDLMRGMHGFPPIYKQLSHQFRDWTE